MWMSASGSPSANGISIPTIRPRSVDCAGTRFGQTSAPPSSAMNSRRLKRNFARSSSLLKNLESGAFSSFCRVLGLGGRGVFACWQQFPAL